jgi:murein L,D-transpeptidase YcbB/YkuD
LLFLLSCHGAHATAEEDVATAIRAALTPPQTSLTARTPGHVDSPSPELRLYSDRRYAGLWTHEAKISPQAQQVLVLLSHAQELGLRPDDYDVEPLMAAGMRLVPNGTPSAAQAAAFDIQLTQSALHYLHDAHFGRIDPRRVGFELAVPRAPFDSTTALLDMSRADAGAANAVAVNTVARIAASAEPQFYHYKLLKDSLSQYRALARDPPPLLTAPAHPIKVGNPYTQASALRQTLIRLGDLSPDTAPSADPLTFDAALSAGIRRFQARHGLRIDGVLNSATSRTLAVPLAARVRQIELTLERWRWVPEFSAPPVIVNIPQFRLFAFNSLQDRKSDVLQMDVIVGRAFRPAHTPVFVADMTSVIFRPYWQVPDSIVKKEMLPKLERQPDYLQAQHLDIVSASDEVSRPLALSSETVHALREGRLKLRQRPGPDDALGLVKFSLPNPYDVYLHSTPTPALFKEPVRAFSHGCIRVSDPVALAVHVLRDTSGEWTAQKVREAMDGEVTQHVRLAHPVPVLILYGTALATEDGRILFFDDIYGHDRQLAALLGP